MHFKFDAAKPFSADEYYCWVTQDLEMIEQMKAIQDASHRDFLTGLHNRRYFFEAGQGRYVAAKCAGGGIAVAMVDIDRFKGINDTYGHEAGDAVLIWVAKIIKEKSRASDIVARFGGEESCLLVEHKEGECVSEVFDRLLTHISEQVIEVGGSSIRVTVGVGVCSVLKDSLEVMINNADEKLYCAKQAGRNRAVV